MIIIPAPDPAASATDQLPRLATQREHNSRVDGIVHRPARQLHRAVGRELRPIPAALFSAALNVHARLISQVATSAIANEASRASSAGQPRSPVKASSNAEIHAKSHRARDGKAQEFSRHSGGRRGAHHVPITFG